MYSYEERMKAVRLYVEYNHSGAAAVRKLGYPTRRTLREWHKEYVESGDLHAKYPKRAKYSDEQKREAVEYYLLHGRSISGTIRALGYPCRETLREWIDELFPGLRSVAIRSGRGVPFSEEQKRAAVIELCSRDGSASSIADAFGVSRVGLYKWKHELLGHKERASMKVPDKQSSSDDRDELAREVERLRKRIYRLQLEHDILKEANELLKKDEGINPQILTNREKTLLIDALRTRYPLSDLLGQVRMAKSSYFYHSARLLRPDKYGELRRHVKQVFHENRRCYGYRRINAVLRRAGRSVSEKVIRRIMSEEDLIASARRRRRYQAYQGEISPAVENLIKRDFHAHAPNVKWLTDITEFQIPEGKVYLSPIIDCFDGMVVSWTIGTTPNAEMVNDMLDDAVAGLIDGQRPIVHSDRGSHYRWPGWISRMKRARLTRSMSRKACTADNAACEGFFGRLKNEMYYNRHWSNTSTEEFMDTVNEYIRWYNQERIKMSLGAMSPAAYRNSLGLAA